MRKLYKYLSLALAVIMLALSAASCATDKGGDGTTGSTGTNAPATDAPKEEEELVQNGRQVEALNRGLFAVKAKDNGKDGYLVSWRSLGTESNDTVYELYRDGEMIYKSESGMPTCYLDEDGSQDSVYTVKTGEETTAGVTPIGYNYFDIPLNKPDPGKTPAGEMYTYTPNDCSCGDLDGDGEYEIVVKWDPSNAKDNSQNGYTGNVYLDAYKLDGTQLWRIDLGVNIRAGAHYTQFLVYDFDGDGIAEVVCKTSDGTVDGEGYVIGNTGDNTDYRDSGGRILKGFEYLTIFNGKTGGEIETIKYEPARGSVDSWGDNYGNRCDRFLAAVAYLDGKTPSIVMCRGYYTRAVLVAYNFDGNHLNKVWTFDSNDGGASSRAAGQGNHNLAVADVDGDGFDEIVYGQCCIDHDGALLWSTGLGHGDAVHVGDFLPDRDGLEIWGCLEGSHGAYLAEAESGKLLRRYNSDRDTGRALADNFITGNDSAEFMCATTSAVFTGVDGQFRGTWSGGLNFAVYMTGKLERCGLDGTNVYSHELGNVMSLAGTIACNGTKATPCLTADLLGDWREEIVMARQDGEALRVFLTRFETEYRLPTLMHNTMYRCGVANENVAYNIPPHTEWFLDTDYPLPDYPEVYMVKAK